MNKKKTLIAASFSVVLFLFSVAIFIPYSGWNILPAVNDIGSASLKSFSKTYLASSVTISSTHAKYPQEPVGLDMTAENVNVKGSLPKKLQPLKDDASVMLAEIKSKSMLIGEDANLVSHDDLLKLVQEVENLK